MPRRVELPPQLHWLQGKVGEVRKKTKQELCCSCPRCGGKDRLCIFLDPPVRVWCRQCGYFKFADANEPIDQSKVDAWLERQKKREEERKRRAVRALKNLRRLELHRKYHKLLYEHDCNYWQRVRHLPQYLVDYWCLGYDPAHYIAAGPDSFKAPTATIPLLAPKTGELLNLKHRIIKPEHEDYGRYRYEIAGQPSPPFVCNPDEDLDGHVIAIEGEIKSMVTFATLDDSSLRIVGLPGATPGQHIVDMLSDAERITLVMDPGARKQAWDLAKALGTERVWVLVSPLKIDDGIIEAGMDKHDVRELLRQALWAGG